MIYTCTGCGFHFEGNATAYGGEPGTLHCGSCANNRSTDEKTEPKKRGRYYVEANPAGSCRVISISNGEALEKTLEVVKTALIARPDCTITIKPWPEGQ